MRSQVRLITAFVFRLRKKTRVERYSDMAVWDGVSRDAQHLNTTMCPAAKMPGLFGDGRWV